MTSGMGGKPYDTGRLSPGRTRYTDKSFPFTTSSINPVTTKPDFDFIRLGLLFPQNDPTEKVYILDNISHEYDTTKPIYPHVHFLQESALIPVFKIDYRHYDQADDEPAVFTTISTADGTGPAFVWSGNPMLQVIPFPAIQSLGTGKLSSHLDLVFYRDDNVVVGDVLVKYMDYHYEKDSDGSLHPWYK